MDAVITYYTYPGGFWFRVFGYGFSIVDRSRYAPLFSERYGYTKVLFIGKYAITALGRRGWTL